jgi:competence protein ComEC
MWTRWLLVVLATGSAFVGAIWQPPAALAVVGLVGGLVLAVVAAGAREAWALVVAAALAAVGGPLLRGQAWSRARTDAVRWVEQHLGSEEALTVDARLRADARVDQERVRAPIDILSIDGRPFVPPLPATISVAGELSVPRVGQWTKGRSIQAVAALGRPPVYRNFGVEERWPHLSRAAVSLSVKSAALVEVTARAPPWSEAFARARALVRQRVESRIRPLGDTTAAVALAILLGERASLDPRLVERLQQAGIYHVMALSGGNVALVLWAIVWLRHVRRTAHRTWAVGAGLLLMAYGGLVSAEPSVARAIAVAALYVCAAALDVRATPGHLLAVVAIGVVTWDPGALFDVGAWLTFAATAGLIGLAEPVATWVVSPLAVRLEILGVRVPRAVLAMLTASVCAELSLWPIALFAFGQVTLLGVVLNFAAVPLMAIVQVAATLAVVVHQAAAPIAAAVVHWAVQGVLFTARAVDAWPVMVFAGRPPSPVAMAAYFTALLLWATRGRPAVPNHLLVVPNYLLAAVVASAAWLVAPSWSGAHERLLTMTVLDVGQGDATLVRFPSGHALLVDGGGVAGGGFDVGERVVRPALAALGIQRLTHVAVTHGDPDHIGGLRSVVGRLRPTEVWEGVPVPDHEPSAALATEARRVGAAWRRLQAGDNVAFGDAHVTVLHPPLPDWERVRVRNDDSLVLVIRYGEVTMVLPGDIGHAVESVLSARRIEGAIRIVKVPHHGSRTSSSEPWLKWVRPSVAIVSAGPSNRFGHPAADVLERYRAAGALILRTDEDGAVQMRTDGIRVELETVSGRVASLVAEGQVSPVRPP